MCALGMACWPRLACAAMLPTACLTQAASAPPPCTPRQCTPQACHLPPPLIAVHPVYLLCHPLQPLMAGRAWEREVVQPRGRLRVPWGRGTLPQACLRLPMPQALTQPASSPAACTARQCMPQACLPPTPRSHHCTPTMHEDLPSPPPLAIIPAGSGNAWQYSRTASASPMGAPV